MFYFNCKITVAWLIMRGCCLLCLFLTVTWTSLLCITIEIRGHSSIFNAGGVTVLCL